ncbi:MAG: crossover junction endodeoxyribonuclease RuvC [Anaeromyxobacter sp.]|nr:crossover junction endodeoxyribonuclease RuvC [Anaeromyxobacter sp.]MBL0277376.1 crossover junction endodeoxyribonuclease RuvC [Anaeromyxobacter sp.]
MIVLGIDPGSRRCGYGVVAREGGRLHVVESGVLAPGERPMAERLGLILAGLDVVIARARPDEVAVEQVFSGASARSALVLGQARGVALAAAGRAGLPVHEYAPSAVKLAFTGSGRAGKEQMMRTARALLGVLAACSDEADAVALAVCHLARRPLAEARTAAALARAPAGARLAAPHLTTPRAAAARALSRLRPSRRDHRRSP